MGKELLRRNSNGWVRHSKGVALSVPGCFERFRPRGSVRILFCLDGTDRRLLHSPNVITSCQGDDHRRESFEAWLRARVGGRPGDVPCFVGPRGRIIGLLPFSRLATTEIPMTATGRRRNEEEYNGRTRRCVVMACYLQSVV